MDGFDMSENRTVMQISEQVGQCGLLPLCDDRHRAIGFVPHLPHETKPRRGALCKVPKHHHLDSPHDVALQPFLHCPIVAENGHQSRLTNTDYGSIINTVKFLNAMP